MQVQDKLHGFTVLSVRRLEEIDTELVEMVYEKNGARLLWLDRPDDNMTFSITFRTIPSDDTGVFHILEHSVLNGSDKYPSKEPFVDLLKTSLQTFLNAFTAQDHTMYPVSSRNRRDFLNLTDVYMDAVFHPLVLKRKETFLQEGWHYEYDVDGKLTRSGVVYNEMKGDYGSVDTQLTSRMQRLLYGDTCYGFESGGAPDHIPELTYEAFCAAHRRYYHPSNAYIVLDGRIPVDETLALIDSYLAPYEASDRPVELEMRSPMVRTEEHGFYELDPGEDTGNKTYMAIGCIYGTYDEQVKALGLEVLADTLCGSNEAPLRKAVLAEDLAETVSLSGGYSNYYLQASIVCRNTDPSKIERLQNVLRDALEAQAGGGLDRSQLEASLSILEFALRERDYGTMPKGVVFADALMGSWLYGGDPAQNLCYEDAFHELRERIHTGWYEQLIREILLDNPEKAVVILEPSTTLGEEKAAAAAAELENLSDSWNEDRKDAVRAETERLTVLQQTPDAPETVACLPHLGLNDLTDGPKLTLPEADKIGSSTLLTLKADTAGILYGELYFDLSDLSTDELSMVSFMSGLLGELNTEISDAATLQKNLKSELGSFGCGVEGYGPLGRPLECTPYAVVNFSLLESKKEHAAKLLGELLTRTAFENTRLIGQMLRQKKLGLRENIIDSGHSFAVGRVNASSTAKGVITDAVSGIGQYQWLIRANETFEKDPAAFTGRLSVLYGKVFSRKRAMVSLTGRPERIWAERLLSELREGEEPGSRLLYLPGPARREGLILAADVSYAAAGANLFNRGEVYRGDMNVSALHLSYNYLWNVIRVQNGAYGAGFSTAFGGDLRLYTYRDPNPSNSLATFMAMGRWLADNQPDRATLESLIIGAVGETDPIRTPRLNAKLAANWWLSEVPEDVFSRRHREILATDRTAMAAFGGTLERILTDCSMAVLGGKEQIEKCGDLLTDISTLA